MAQCSQRGDAAPRLCKLLSRVVALLVYRRVRATRLRFCDWTKSKVRTGRKPDGNLSLNRNRWVIIPRAVLKYSPCFLFSLASPLFEKKRDVPLFAGCVQLLNPA